MRSFYYLPQSHKAAYFDGRNKSKSPLNNFRKTPPRNIFQKDVNKKNPIPGVTFSSKANKKKQQLKSNMHNPIQKRLHYSQTNSDLGQFYKNHHIMSVDNIEQEIFPYGRGKTESEQYFAASIQKISEMRKKYYTNKINSQLDEVFNMIKEQKLKISEKMKILKRNNEYYTQKIDGYVAETANRATNTDYLLDEGFEKCYKEQEIQVVEEQLEQKNIKQENYTETENNKNIRNIQKEKEYYLKLCNMLDQMKINYEQILPDLDGVEKVINSKDYKMLGDAQVIKIQKFFIKKLASKLTSSK